MRVAFVVAALLVAAVAVSARLPANLVQLSERVSSASSAKGMASLGTAAQLDPAKLTVVPKPLVAPHYVGNICDVKRGDKCGEDGSFLVLNEGIAPGTAAAFDINKLKVVPKPLVTANPVDSVCDVKKGSAARRCRRRRAAGDSDDDDGDDEASESLLQVGTGTQGYDPAKLKVTPQYLITAHHVDNICDVKRGPYSRCRSRSASGDDDDSFLLIGVGTASAESNQMAPWGTGGRDGGPLGRGGKPVVHPPELKIQPVYVCNGIQRKHRCSDSSDATLEPVVAHNVPRKY